MKALLLPEYGRFQIVDMDAPVAGPDDVLAVRVPKMR